MAKKSDVKWYMLGAFGVGTLCGFACAIILRRNRNPIAMVDHIVIRTHNKTQECKQFYRLLGFEIEREKESEQWEQTQKGSITFPMVRINNNQVIDLFSDLTKRVWCEKSKGNIDHICLSMSANQHLQCLKQLKANEIYCVKQFKAFGAQGYGWSTYFNDPTGLYVELRNYETDKWHEIESFAKTMIQSQ
eukprot:192590_1